ncbi:hypothetical protein EMCRGX_G032298 [Ephydatia muelleri]|eukprot:Em0019g542a
MGGELEFRGDHLLDSLAIPPRIVAALKKAGLAHIRCVLTHSASDLARKTGLSRREIDNVLVLLSKTALPRGGTPSTALELHREQSKRANQGRLTTGCHVIDSHLCGGLLVQGITEIAGISAAGKTQLCLQLCLTVQLPLDAGGLAGGAVYVCTEDAFPNKRLLQLSNSFARKYSHIGLTANHLTDSIYIEHAATISTLSVLLKFKLPVLLAEKCIRLVVIDSLAALFRVEFTHEQISQRAQLLQAFGAQLHGFADQYGVAVVCVNQVTSEVGGGVKPSLGLAWSNMVTTRLIVQRDETLHDSEIMQEDAIPSVRSLRVAFAPHLPPTSINYYITQDGIHGHQT